MTPSDDRIPPRSPGVFMEKTGPRGAFPHILRVLEALSILGILVGSVVLGSFAQQVVDPPQPLVASPAVTVQPGVIFVLPAAHVNLTFANNLTASSQITLPGYGKSLVVDSVNVSVYKSPNTYPGITMTVTTWNPTNNVIGTAVLIASVIAPAGTQTLYLNLSGLAPSVFVFPLVNGAAQGGMVTDTFGSAQFAFWSWNSLSQTIEIDVGNVGSGPGIVPGIHIFPSFSVARYFSIFNATAEEWVRFQDTSRFSANATVYRLWKFGDGTSANATSPWHHYVFGISGSFNATLVVCAGNACNSTTQPVPMIRWSLLVFGGALTGLSAATLLAVWRGKARPNLKVRRVIVETKKEIRRMGR